MIVDKVGNSHMFCDLRRALGGKSWLFAVCSFFDVRGGACVGG